MLFFCAVIYKYDALTASDDVQEKMSLEQVGVVHAVHCHAWLTIRPLLAEG